MTELKRAIENLADQLATPVVPGEAAAWLKATSKAADTAAALWWRNLESVLVPKYGQIVREDPELTRRVEQMKANDRQYLEELASLLDRLKNLQAQASQAEADEATLKEGLDVVVQRGLEFVNHARMQEKAVDTWLAEAFQRDRGVAD